MVAFQYFYIYICKGGLWVVYYTSCGSLSNSSILFLSPMCVQLVRLVFTYPKMLTRLIIGPWIVRSRDIIQLFPWVYLYILYIASCHTPNSDSSSWICRCHSPHQMIWSSGSLSWICRCHFPHQMLWSSGSSSWICRCHSPHQMILSSDSSSWICRCHFPDQMILSSDSSSWICSCRSSKQGAKTGVL